MSEPSPEPLEITSDDAAEALVSGELKLDLTPTLLPSFDEMSAAMIAILADHLHGEG